MFANFNKNLLVLFILLTFAGALRKWVIDNTAINLLLTILGTVSLFIFFYFQQKDNQRIIHKELAKLLPLFMFYLALCAFNPLNHTVFHGLIGIVIHLGFWIVIFNYLDNKNRYNLFKFNNIIIIVSIIQIGISVMQYTAPSDSAWNTLKGNSSMAISDDAIQTDSEDTEGDSFNNTAFVGEGTRATGTFSYLGGYYAYIIFHMLFTFSLFIRKSPTYLSITMLFIGFLGTILNGSRSLTIVYIIVNLVFFIFQLRNIKILLNITGLGIIFFIINTVTNDFSGIEKFTSSAIDNMLNRVELNEAESKVRISGPIDNLFNYDGEYPIFGIGLGATYPGINSIFGASSYVIKHAYENEIARTIQDGGYILLLFKIALYIMLIKHLSLNKVFSTILFLILFFGTLITTNTYLSFYLVFGIIFLNQAIIDKKTIEK